MDPMNIPLYKRLYEDIKFKILRDEYKKNERLESVRSLAKRLDISTTTVEKAYHQLLVEGYIKSIPRSGYNVVDVKDLEVTHHAPLVEPIPLKEYSNNRLTEDLFDMKSFKTTINKVLNYDGEKLYSECNPSGEIELREEIRKYVLKERDVECDVNQIIVGPGIQSLLHILLSLVDKKSVTYLAPRFKKAMNIFDAHNYVQKPRKSVYDITRIKADFLYISPSNIYPTGEVLKVKDRNKLIKWARENESYIIEDDYNFFIRYNSYTVPSIHSIDHGKNVVYMGSFAKTIIPSMRISFMILPVDLYNIYRDVYENFSQGVSKLDQLSLALFMKEGLFRRHTKKLYKLYQEKNNEMKLALTKYVKKQTFKIRGTDSNLHVIFDFQNKTAMQSFIRNCERYVLKYSTIDGTNSIIFPYSGIERKNIKKLVRDLFYNI